MHRLLSAQCQYIDRRNRLDQAFYLLVESICALYDSNVAAIPDIDVVPMPPALVPLHHAAHSGPDTLGAPLHILFNGALFGVTTDVYAAYDCFFDTADALPGTFLIALRMGKPSATAYVRSLFVAHTLFGATGCAS